MKKDVGGGMARKGHAKSGGGNDSETKGIAHSNGSNVQLTR